MFLLLIFIPWLILFALIAMNSRVLQNIFISNFPKLIVNTMEDKRAKTFYASISPIRVYDSSNDIVISWGEFIGSQNSIKKLGNNQLYSKWQLRQKLKRIFSLYSIFSILSVIGYIIYLVLTYEI